MCEFYAGYGEAVITPPIGTELAGFGYYRNRRADKILDDLKVRAIAISSNESSVLLICCDLLGFTIEFSDSIRNAIASKTGLDLQNIMLSCTHTHSGPASQYLRAFGEIQPEYLDSLPEKILFASQEAIKDKKKSVLSYGSGNIDIAHNRLDEEPLDSKIRIGVFTRLNDKIYMLNAACHPVTMGGTNDITADWLGALVSNIEKEGNKGIVFQGFCGNINPTNERDEIYRGNLSDITKFGKLLYNQVLLAEKNTKTTAANIINTVELRIRLPLVVPDNEKDIEIEAINWKEDVESIIKENPVLYGWAFNNYEKAISSWKAEAISKLEQYKANPYWNNIPVQGIRIGDIRILALSGEVFCEYAIQMDKETDTLFTVGYANGNIGYFPTKKAYSIKSLQECYGDPKIYDLFRFSSDIENIIMESSRKVLKVLELS